MYEFIYKILSSCSIYYAIHNLYIYFTYLTFQFIYQIKSSLVGFEKELLTLQQKVGNLVNNYDIVNNSIEDKLKQADNNYKIKKDLKRVRIELYIN